MTLNELTNIADSPDSLELMPLLFVGHGSPMNAIEDNEFTSGWREAGKKLPRPKAILCISAHWETRGTFVTAMEKPKTIHDFYGFPPELFEVDYPAKGNPALAEQAKKLVTQAIVMLDTNWGLDHGCWSVVRRMYPNADVPVLQLSLDHYQSPDWHYNLAKDLAPLRRNGVLIIGSGNIVHNLRMINWQHPDSAYDWAEEMNVRFKEYILHGNYMDLINYPSLGKAAALSVPTQEHFLPMLYVLGLKEDNENITIFNDKIVLGSISMTSFRIS